MSDLWIPIIGIICIALIIVSSLYLSAREKQQLHKTLQQHLSNGGELSPALLQQLGANVDMAKRDRRKGILLVALGVACIVSGALSGHFVIGAVFGVFPLFVGSAFYILALQSNDG
ncbi:DUF6249 domain-containing protein [Pseudidiomarina sediminum]|uniref:DUF6249 domain-containing protein n=1 Tax=Pseudidiomarina sediminum TaxID=431675 RepID=UPI001C984353|nr:DUF6249 domain-containing protein [Pseudidiomarina sediminum]MBY6064684.1 hypothetical protein [Pseudidiomarina sediminum]